MIAAKWHSYQSTCSEMDFDSAMSDYGLGSAHFCHRAEYRWQFFV
jgi:hypothetical protein